MGKPFLPMISGILEMIMRVLVIALFIGKIGFAAAAYSEIAAWCGALSINIFAFIYFIGKKKSSDKKVFSDLAIKKC